MPSSGDSEPDSNDSVREKIRFISEALADLKDRTREVEKRVRSIEAEDLDQIRKSMYKLENHVSNFKSASDTRRERWNMVLNFVVQLVWVVMASYVLTKLGLGVDPL